MEKSASLGRILILDSRKEFIDMIAKGLPDEIGITCAFSASGAVRKLQLSFRSAPSFRVIGIVLGEGFGTATGEFMTVYRERFQSSVHLWTVEPGVIWSHLFSEIITHAKNQSPQKQKVFFNQSDE